MKSLAEIEKEVESFAKTQLDGSGRMLWGRLVDGSRQIAGAGCNGILMAQLEKYTESLLSAMDDQALCGIWQQTENGMMAIEEGNDSAEKCEMLHDIGLDVNCAIVEQICLEAKRKP